MKLLNIIWQYKTDILAAVSLLSLVLEVAPVKLSPWSSLLSWLGKKLNADILKDITSIQAQLKAQDAKIDNNEKDRIRYEILAFASDCRNKEEHTQEEFDHILEQYDKYELILAKLEQPNGKITQAMKYINDLYLDRYKQNDFLS